MQSVQIKFELHLIEHNYHRKKTFKCLIGSEKLDEKTDGIAN